MKSKVFTVHYSELENELDKWLKDNMRIKRLIMHNINDMIILVIFYTI
jgi:hypothetical protein